jgi:hypothetical protein
MFSADIYRRGLCAARCFKKYSDAPIRQIAFSFYARIAEYSSGDICGEIQQSNNKIIVSSVVFTEEKICRKRKVSVSQQ